MTPSIRILSFPPGSATRIVPLGGVSVAEVYWDPATRSARPLPEPPAGSEAVHLLAAYRADPRDRLSLMAFADWLADRGDQDLAAAVVAGRVRVQAMVPAAVREDGWYVPAVALLPERPARRLLAGHAYRVTRRWFGPSARFVLDELGEVTPRVLPAPFDPWPVMYRHWHPRPAAAERGAA
jgi:uncharacterized protein (TIGR02996 family)